MNADKNIPNAIKPIIDASNGLLRYSSRKRNAYRIQKATKENVCEQKIIEILNSAKYKMIEKYQPGHDNALSGKYVTWLIDNNVQKINVVFGTGQNAGHLYEDTFIEGIKQAIQTKNGNYFSLLKEMNIEVNDLLHVKKTSNRNVKRPLTKKIEKAGAEISDIELVLQNKNEYISLKAENGSTFANGGYNGGFQFYENKIISSNHDLDEFIIALGINKEIAATGLNDYLNANNSNHSIEKNYVFNISKDTIKTYLAAAYGYGYWYIRKNKRKENGFEVYNIANEEASFAKVGEILDVKIKYPYYTRLNDGKIKKSKQISAWIRTTENMFLIEVRNSQGNVIPNEIKIKAGKEK